MEDLLQDENQEMILELTPAARSSLEVENFVTSANALSEDLMISNLLKRKSDLQLSLAHFNQPLLTLDILPKNGKKIAPKNVFLVFHSPAF